MEKVLVLNADYTPLNVTSYKKGFNLVYKGKAEVLKSSESNINSGYQSHIRPLVIRLLKYVKYRIETIKVNRNRIYKRDGYECIYCGSKKKLTIDHVLPRSKGGDNSWKNLVTCCHSCNLYKADRTPNEAGLVMRKQPYVPTIFSEVIHSNLETIWEDFKKTFKMV
jgi:5-methylcytosine-specific restriction endonuclease McrA